MTSPDAIADAALIQTSIWQRMTSQQRADRMLSEWQANRHLPPAERLNDNQSLDDVDRAIAAVVAEIEQ